VGDISGEGSAKAISGEEEGELDPGFSFTDMFRRRRGRSRGQEKKTCEKLNSRSLM